MCVLARDLVIPVGLVPEPTARPILEVSHVQPRWRVASDGKSSVECDPRRAKGLLGLGIQMFEELKDKFRVGRQTNHRPSGEDGLDRLESVARRVPERAFCFGLYVTVEVADLPVGRLERHDRDTGLIERRVVAEPVGC